MDDLERYEFVVARGDPADEEQRGVSSIDDLGVCQKKTAKRSHASCIHDPRLSAKRTRRGSPLYSRKLHMRVRRASTSWVTSLTILALAFGAIVVNHFARRTFPDEEVIV